jgi:hypothetical protein
MLLAVRIIMLLLAHSYTADRSDQCNLCTFYGTKQCEEHDIRHQAVSRAQKHPDPDPAVL